MWAILALTCLSMLDRSDFVNVNSITKILYVYLNNYKVVMGIFIFVLFIKGKELDVVANLELFLKVFVITLGYDVFWLYFHSSVCFIILILI